MSKTSFLLSRRQQMTHADVTKMFTEDRYFDMSKITEAVKVMADRDLSSTQPEEYRALAAWHCIDFDKMPEGVKNTLIELSEEVVGIRPASNN